MWFQGRYELLRDVTLPQTGVPDPNPIDRLTEGKLVGDSEFVLWL